MSPSPIEQTFDREAELRKKRPTSSLVKHFVHFFSPGTFVAEETVKEIPSWDVEKAKKMARSVVERYNATPYGFCFSTRERGADDFDSRETKRSQMYYLGGKVETLAEVEARNDPKEGILVGNMKCNGWDRVIVNTNSWKTVQPFRDGDVLLPWP